MDDTVSMTLRPYADGDLRLLKSLLGDPVAMRFLGGAESDEAIEARHARYLASNPATGELLVIVADSEPVGWIGYWTDAASDSEVLEAGWHVLRERQGRGIASAALLQLINRARERATHRYLDAYPGGDNVASNALCRATGFRLLGEIEVEYPKGRMMRANHWRVDLTDAASS